MSSSSTSIVPPTKKRRIEPDALRTLVAQGRQTKSSLASTLQVLKEQGRLAEGATKRQLRVASEHHANQDTAYGKVVQRVDLNLNGLKYLDIVHPLAFLYYLCRISASFGKLMYDCCSSGHPLRLVLYADEMNPGSPFRPEKSRVLQCIYWAFVD